MRKLHRVKQIRAQERERQSRQQREAIEAKADSQRQALYSYAGPISDQYGLSNVRAES